MVNIWSEMLSNFPFSARLMILGCAGGVFFCLLRLFNGYPPDASTEAGFAFFVSFTVGVRLGGQVVKLLLKSLLRYISRTKEMLDEIRSLFALRGILGVGGGDAVPMSVKVRRWFLYVAPLIMLTFVPVLILAIGFDLWFGLFEWKYWMIVAVGVGMYAIGGVMRNVFVLSHRYHRASQLITDLKVGDMNAKDPHTVFFQLVDSTDIPTNVPNWIEKAFSINVNEIS